MILHHDHTNVSGLASMMPQFTTAVPKVSSEFWPSVGPFSPLELQPQTSTMRDKQEKSRWENITAGGQTVSTCRVSSGQCWICGRLYTRIYAQPGCPSLVGQVWKHHAMPRKLKSPTEKETLRVWGGVELPRKCGFEWIASRKNRVYEILISLRLQESLVQKSQPITETCPIM